MYFSSNIDTNYTFFGKCNYNKKRIPHNIKSCGIQREKKDKKLIINALLHHSFCNFFKRTKNFFNTLNLFRFGTVAAFDGFNYIFIVFTHLTNYLLY